MLRTMQEQHDRDCRSTRNVLFAVAPLDRLEDQRCGAVQRPTVGHDVNLGKQCERLHRNHDQHQYGRVAQPRPRDIAEGLPFGCALD